MLIVLHANLTIQRENHTISSNFKPDTWVKRYNSYAKLTFFLHKKHGWLETNQNESIFF